jgi:hypothetical protein
MDIEKVDTPALLFSPNYSTVEYVHDKTILSVTTQSGLKKGIVIGNIVVDSSGSAFKTISAKKKGNCYSFWRFEFFDPFIYVELEVEKVKDDIDLADLKNKVFKIVKRDEDEWTNYGDVKEIKRSIEESKTHRELIAVIGKYIHPITEK